MNLRDQGFRFVFRDGDFSWVSTARETDIDCTDMTDEEFDAFAIPILKEQAKDTP